MTHDCDVLVVGAGPVGTALALELALHGVSFRVIDRIPARNDKSRALIMQPRTLELLNRHGAADSMIARGRILRGASTYIKKQLVVKLDLDNLGTTDTEFPLPLNVSQVETERFLEECLSKYGISVERPVTATSIIQDDSGVTSTLELPDGTTETVRSKYVVGCDGAHSVVRHASEKMTFPGAPYPHNFILCDARLRDSNIVQDRLSLYLSSDLLAFFPINDTHIRIVASTSENIVKGQDLPTVEQLQAHITSKTPPGSGTIYDVTWLTRFRLHHRCVNQYRDGRLFVAGDAAHIHSPAGGQGMNAGIQDAVNLGWKLAHALTLESQAQAQASSPTSSLKPPTTPHSPTPLTPAAAAAAATALLDTYNLERRPVGLALLKGTDRIFSFVAGPGPWLVPLRDFVLRHVAPRVTRDPGRRGKMFHFMSNFGVSYRGRSGIVGEAAAAGGWFGGVRVRGGDRLVDGRVLRVRGLGDGGDDGGETSLQRVCVGRWHHLLLFAGEEGGKGGMGEGELRSVAERVVAACKAEVRVHYVAGDERVVEGGEEWYTDPGLRLHGKFGFGSRAGYVLVRPDGYVAHIGPLAKLDQFVAFLDGYLVSPVVTPSRSVLSWVYPVVWTAVSVCLAVKLWGRIAQGV
jgi:2-polyprenyl-6-methoxyphenol hydroxylase-like FAD-dependent oxidoreductase